VWHLVFLAFFAFSIYRFIVYQRRWTTRNTYDYQRRRFPPMKRAHGNDLVDVAGLIVGETEKAWRFNDGTKVEWLAKSQCEWDEEAKVMTMPIWLAYEKGLV
jgi:hypothetical protein